MNVKFNKKPGQSKDKIKAKLIKYALPAAAIIVILFVIYFAFSIFFAKNDDKVVGNISSSQEANKQTQKPTIITIYKASEDISLGQPIDVTKFYTENVALDSVPENVIKSATEFKETVAIHMLHKNEVILADDIGDAKLWIEDSDRLVEHSFAAGTIPASVKDHSVIDVKLFLPDQEDPYVISKAIVQKRTENVLTFYLNRLEQELLKQAASEGNIFVVEYYDYNQPASEVNYKPKYNKQSQGAKPESTTPNSNNNFSGSGFRE